MRHPGSTKTQPTTDTTSRTRRRSPSSPKRRRGHHAPTAPPASPVPSKVMRGLRGGRPDDAETRQLWALTPAQRVSAMNAGRLSLGQLAAWTSARPGEVPLLGGEFAWIAMHEPCYCEPRLVAGAI